MISQEDFKNFLIMWQMCEPNAAMFSSQEMFNFVTNSGHVLSVRWYEQSTKDWDIFFVPLLERAVMRWGFKVQMESDGEGLYIAELANESFACEGKPHVSKGIALIVAYASFIYQLGRMSEDAS